VTAVPVAEGQTVVAWQPLVVLDNREAKAAVAEAQAAVVQAETRLKQIRNVGLPTAEQALRRAQANLANASKQFVRAKELQASDAASRAELDQARMTLEVAKADVSSAQLQVQTNRSTGSDYSVALSALAQAEANLGTALAKFNYTTILAPVDGTLIARSVERGDVVQPGKVLMVLSPAGQTQLVVEIDEKNMASMRLGQTAIASADAYPAQRFDALVDYINPGVDADRGSVEVKLAVPKPPAYLRQDMTVSVDIEIARHANTLVLAADAVHDSLTPAPWVMQIVGGKAARRPVRLGARGGGKVEILAGLSVGDVAISAAVANISDGKRVRAGTKQ
jgi:HlyD family secretion protein